MLSVTSVLHISIYSHHAAAYLPPLKIIMSGIEIAGLVFGAVPIVVETLKSYSLIRNKLHTCRHYSDEVEEVAAKLTSSRANFNNEVQLLRRCLKETGSTGDLDMEVNDALDESYRSCIQTVDRTKRLLDKMTPDMKKFDAILEKKSQVRTSTSLGAYGLSLGTHQDLTTLAGSLHQKATQHCENYIQRIEVRTTLESTPRPEQRAACISTTDRGT